MVKIKCPHRSSLLVYVVPLVECAVLGGILFNAVGYMLGMTNLEYVRKNWQTLKCNPQYVMYYPMISHDMEKDATSCVSSIMTQSVGQYLNPLNVLFGGLTSLGLNLSNQMKQFGGGVDFIRANISNIVSDFFSYILKILLIFSKFQIALKQILARFVGVILSSVYMMRGQMYFGNSIWKGAPGQMIRALSSTKIGHCFHENTKIKLNNGDVQRIKDITIGTVLDGHIRVVATMKILNVYKEPYYELPGGVDGDPIHVSGTHYVYNAYSSQFQIVETQPHAKKTNIITEEMYCLITDTNMIYIGRCLFWDWEDYKINPWSR
jgi:hypothetical protein